MQYVASLLIAKHLTLPENRMRRNNCELQSCTTFCPERLNKHKWAADTLSCGILKAHYEWLIDGCLWISHHKPLANAWDYDSQCDSSNRLKHDVPQTHPTGAINIIHIHITLDLIKSRPYGLHGKWYGGRCFIIWHRPRWPYSRHPVWLLRTTISYMFIRWSCSGVQRWTRTSAVPGGPCGAPRACMANCLGASKVRECAGQR